MKILTTYKQLQIMLNKTTSRMESISSYIFFDIETTGLPWQERNQTKITELSFIAVSRKDIERTAIGSVPPVSKLTLTFNPQKDIHQEAALLTRLSNDLLKYSPTFSQKVNTILSFLEDLPKPVCLVAHNGNRFDYKILLAECADANVSLPSDLLCVDSLTGFQKLLKEPNANVYQTSECFSSSFVDDLLTDDDDDVEWPDLDVSAEDWKHIDELSKSISQTSIETDHAEVRRKPHHRPRNNGNKKVKKINKERVSYKLTDLYERLINKGAINAHTAEFDCIMLLECVVAMKNIFLQWADDNCKCLSAIEPLKRL